ncbi:MAG: porin [Rhodoferax sp.]|nr:porin [Rhodoferax sp.]
MKESLLACLVFGAFASAASAQSSLRIYGTVDGGLRNLSNVDAAGNSKLSINSNGTYQSNRLGFDGKEDLGNGMNAHFNLESRFQLGSGQQVGVLFNGASYVGLGGAWGSIDVGRQSTIAFKTIVAYDPFRFKYTGIATSISATTGVMDNNAIQYNGTFGPVTARAVYAAGEQAGSTSNGATQGAALSYVNGPANVGAAYTQKKTAVGLETKHYTFGGGYQFGALRAVAGYANQKDQALVGADTVNKYTWAGLQYKTTPEIEIIAAYYDVKKTQAPAIGILVDGKKNLFMLGATYHLSKRTNLYAEIDRSKLSGNFILLTQTQQTGVSAGINHVF